MKTTPGKTAVLATGAALRIHRAITLAAVIVLPGLWAAASETQHSPHLMTVGGKENSVPHSYVPPLVSNGSLSMLVDYLGGQSQRAYNHMTPGIWWAGRRYGPPNDQLIPFGHFEQELMVDGRKCAPPAAWTQTLDTQAAVVTCHDDYANGLSVETVVFTPLDHDLIVVKQRFTATNASVRSVSLGFHYQFTPPGHENRAPKRTSSVCAWDAASRSAQFRYQADGHRPCDGIISVFSDKPVTANIEKQAVTLTSGITLDAAKPVEVTTYLLFADSLDGKDYLERAAKLRERTRQEGYDGLLAAHRKAWAAYGNESYAHIPDEPLENAYTTAQYHLRANATKWSFPVGIFNTHWAGRFFGWDEMFCYQALVSSNHRDIARRCPEFRFAGLQKALDRASHYGKPGAYGARFPWEAMEDGSEAAPPGFWMEHVFHISNIALSAWFQHLYTDDAAYLKNTGYPVIKECARFFLANMVYETPAGGMFIGKCTDLERLGPARQNPFMTTCGAIYTLEAAAQAAALLQADDEEAATWKHAAVKLRESLPHDGDRYVPYPGCKEESVASLGGLFPYPLFDQSDARQRNAAYHFVANGKAAGNMYPVGQSVCAWYAGWMAAALAALGDKTEPAKLLDEAAAGAGCFGEMFEINEPKVSMHPWFSTASGNVVYALNQMLVQCRAGQIRIAPAVPETWKDYSFKLACHGNLTVEVTVKGGRMTGLNAVAGDPAKPQRRTFVVPKTLLDPGEINRAAVLSVSTQGDSLQLDTQFKGRLTLIRGDSSEQTVPPASTATGSEKATKTTAQYHSVSDEQLRAKAEDAWRAAWDRFYDDRTHLFYDFVCSYAPEKRLAGLPTPEEIRQQNPNPNGWGTGMEDCAISGGLLLSMICDRFAATGDTGLRPFAGKAFAGLASLVTLGSSEGFVIRGVCPADARSHYCESSRDQYTWHAYGLWRYYHSPLSQPAEKATMRKIITAVCSRLERNVVAANNYCIGKETGAFDGLVDKMWENAAHEVARLPMIYAIGADLTGDSHWSNLARRYSPEAAAKSKDASTKIPYALLQQQVSLETLYQLEKSPELKQQWLETMRLVAGRAQVFFGNCLKYQPPPAGPISLDWRTWPLRKSSRYLVPARPDFLVAEDRTIREPAEAALVQLLCPQPSLTPEQLRLMKQMIAQMDYAKVVFYGHYYTQAVYWRAVRLGLLKLPAASKDWSVTLMR